VKSLIQAVVAAALAAPVMSFAQQSDAPVAHVQVRAELVQLERLATIRAAAKIRITWTPSRLLLPAYGACQ
jgi:hypothetical protein